MIIRHQLINKPFFLPKWPVKHLFLGTFNPSGGASVPFFYGRTKNKTWKLLSEIFNTNLDPKSCNFINNLQTLQIACMDILTEIEIPSELRPKVVKGYKDAILFHSYVRRTYNIDQINDVIEKNSGVTVYSTWGQGSSMNIETWDKIYSIKASIVPLVSPSMAAKVPEGETKFGYMLADWQKKVKK